MKNAFLFLSYCDYFLHIGGNFFAYHHVNTAKHHYDLLQLRVADVLFIQCLSTK